MGRRRVTTAAAEAADTSPGDIDSGGIPVGRHYKPRRHAPLWLKIVAVTLCGALVAGVGTAGFLLWKLQSNVTTAPLSGSTTPKPSADVKEETGSMQVLILGTDTRAGKNSSYGTLDDSAGEGMSDVMLLMNISADNSRVSVTSFPRDLMVPIPECKSLATGLPVAAQRMGQLNSALLAGPGCTVDAINDMTGLTIDHFMLADFTAVKELSTALGGVQVCVDHAMYDNDGSYLRLPAGKSLVEGEQALAFLRTRHSFGDASDLARIKAQQYFLGSMVRKVKTEGTLTNLPKLYNLADVVTKNLTIDQGLANIPAMIGVADRLSKIDLANVSFVTVPWEPYVGNDQKVQLAQPAAGQFFAALRNDSALTQAQADAQASASAAAQASATGTATEAVTTAPTVPAAPAIPYDKTLQPISVVNASAVVGRTVELVQALAGGGFTKTWSGGNVAAQSETQILYGTDMADVAADVAILFGIPAAQLKLDPKVTGIQLVVGSDWVSGTKFGTITLPPDIVSSTAVDSNECLTVNPAYYTR